MRRPRICMVGGGSWNWAPVLIRDVMLKEGLENAEFRLLDPDIEAAEVIAAVGRRYASEWRLGATMRPTNDPAVALAGADFVLITISTGGLDAMAHDLRIPERYGIFQTVGDTFGPGGWARGLRNIPVFLKLGEQIRKYAPAAMILNYSNPMTTLTKTLTLVTRQPVVGLCHGVFENYRHLTAIFGLKGEEELKLKYCGLNHFFWVLDFSIKGRSGYEALRALRRGGRTLDDLVRGVYVDPAGHASERRLVASELLDEFGRLPYMGDRHTCEAFGRYLTPDRSRLARYKLHQTTIAERRRVRRGTRKRAMDIAAGRAPIERVRSRETAADIMAARWLNREFSDVVNLPNVGQIANLPLGVVVETPGVVNMLGFAPVACGPLPENILNVMMPHTIVMGYIVEAAIEGSWRKADQALIGDPLCQHLTIPRIRKMGRELLEANRRWLPRFFGRKAR